jgi:hypothetical protein
MKRFQGMLLGFMCLIGCVSSAEAIRIQQAEIDAGAVVVAGNQTARSAPITWEGVQVTTSNNSGVFRFTTSILPADCVGALSDGVSALEVVIANCIPAPNPLLAPVPQTGQVLCYDTAGNVINCSGTGQDGAVRKGVPWPNPRFTNNGNGTITDNLTGLIWAQNQNCFSNVPWATALALANTLASGACGLSDGSIAGDWRVPNVMELLSLIHYGTSGPYAYLASQGFSGFSAAGCWSSTTLNDYPAVAFVVAFNNGELTPTPKNGTTFVCLVRGGP